jgi:hypothetical protein
LRAKGEQIFVPKQLDLARKLRVNGAVDTAENALLPLIEPAGRHVDVLSLYRAVTARGIKASRPFVGNGMWVTSLSDPDGYRIEFESLTDVPEDTQYSDPR